MSAPPRLFDRALHRRRLDRAAPRFAAAAFLHRRAAEDLVWRLEAVRRDFPAAIDLASRGGVFAQALASSPARGKIGWLVQSDVSAGMAGLASGARIVADEEALPLRPASVDLAVSILSLHFANDLVGALVQARRTLKPGGLFLAAVLGGATLAELRACLTAAEAELAGGAGPRVSPMLHRNDAPGLLQRAGFSEPVVDTDEVTARYPHLPALIADLRAMGATNVLFERPRAPLGRPLLALADTLYRERFAGGDGRLRATFEILTLTGWAPA